MIQFRCEKCGYKFSAPDKLAGKKGKCPNCKNIVFVPGIKNAEPLTKCPENDASEIDSKDSILDPNLFDIPQKSKEVWQGDVSDKTLENLRKLKADEAEHEPPPKRKLPWLIDIFLYPASKPGLTILGIVAGIPLLSELAVKWLSVFTMIFLPMLVFSLLFAFIGSIVDVILAAYIYWYFCECIRDSAVGGIRAPETMTTTDDLGKILRLVVTWTIFWLPAISYSLIKYSPDKMAKALFTLPEGQSPIDLLFYIIQNDPVFSLLWFCAIYFFPMALLGVTLFESMAGLNPLVIIPSILRTFFKYFLVVIVSYIPIIALFGILELHLLFQKQRLVLAYWICFYVLYGAGCCLLSAI